MLEIVIAGGWVMVPIILCSVMAAAILLERLWTLQPRRVLPPDLSRQVWDWVSGNQLTHEHIQELRSNSPLGQILAAGLASRHQDRATMKEAIEDAGRHVVHELESYLNALGTIAAVSPLLGLLGSGAWLLPSCAPKPPVIRNVVLISIDTLSASSGRPVVNIWCAQTRKPRAPIATNE